MDSLLTKQNIHCASDMDRVVLSIGKLEAQIPYAASFKIAQGLRLASKDAMRNCKESVSNWTEIAKLDGVNQVAPQVSPEKRVTLGGSFKWAAGWDGEDVKLMLGNTIVKFHFTVALKLSEWLREAGRSAKAWAGDSHKIISASGILSDAETNYRMGI